MKLFFTLLILAFSISPCFALTGDTIHVKKYSLHIDSINYVNQTIKGRASLIVQAKRNGVNNITLSLLKLGVNSVTSGNQPLTYSYNDTLIRITPPQTLSLNDTVELTIDYGGSPQLDGKFGGFYFDGVYAFNIGVGFKVDPHVFGRAWFPCIDEFADKSIYDFHIITDSTYKAFCNGNLDSVTNNGNGTSTWHWNMDKPIPSYLAGVAVAPFITINYNYQGIPVQIGCLQADSGATVAAFEHLDSCLMFFINAYGAYPWNKVGYVAVPFAAGAMEHASSVHIGKDYSVNKGYETIWAHELSHMWWGDKVTCSTEQDMWLNEGSALSNEHLFTEFFYGMQAYKNAIRTNHRKVLQFAHAADSGYYALNAVPHAFTYGNTVYQKGADIMRSLRNFMGDSAFFIGCKAYMNNLAYSNASSADFRDQLSIATGIDLTDFFDDWVFTPGFPHFAVDSFTSIPNGGKFDITVYTRQKQQANTHIYTMPVECTFSDGANDTTISISINAATNVFNYTLDFAPLRTTIDRDDKMADASVADERSISAIGATAFTETNASVNVKNVGTPGSVVRVEHNYVAPDDFKVNPGIRVSDYHYYRVDGIFKTSFLAAATFQFNGSNAIGSGFLDNTLITGKEDSMVILYRSGTADDWHIVNGYTANFGVDHNNKIGSFTVDTLKKGEYCFGYRKYNVGIPEQLNAKTSILKIYPNPVSSVGCTLNFQLPYGEHGKIEIIDEAGRLVFSTFIFSHQQFTWWDTFNTKSGIYTATIFAGERKIESANILVVH